MSVSDIWDADLKKELEGLTELAALICDAPVSLINILDSNNQLTKAKVGSDLTLMRREDSFCQYTVEKDEIMVVEDTKKDKRFVDNPLVVGDANVQFYAGVPLRSNKRQESFGAICVIDHKPRQGLSESEKNGLLKLAKEAMARIDLYRKTEALKKANAKLNRANEFLKTSSDIQAVINVDTLKIEEINENGEKLLRNYSSSFEGNIFWEQASQKSVEEKVSTMRACTDAEQFRFSSKVKGKGGAPLYLDITLAREDDALYLTARNITEKKETKKWLTREKRLSDKIVNSLPVGFIMHNIQGNAVRWNDNFMNITGFNNLEIPYADPMHFFTKQARTTVLRKFSKLKANESIFFESEIITKSKKTKPVILNMTSFQSSDMRYILTTVQDISHQKKVQAELKESLEEKKFLLAEVHHRVKNNLAIISGLLQMESFLTDDEMIRQPLNNSQLRVQSIATVHEMLYERKGLANLAFDDFIRKVATVVSGMYKQEGLSIELDLQLDPIKLDINQAIPCGLIMNELLVNAFKHAFDGLEKGVIKVMLTLNEETEEIMLLVRDNGVGMPQEMDPENKSSLGLTLINQLCKQLEGDMRLDRDCGTEICVTFIKKNTIGSARVMDL